MKNFLIAFVFLSFLFLCKNEEKKMDKETVIDLESDEDWSYLFDGKSFDGWHTYLRDTISDQWQD